MRTVLGVETATSWTAVGVSRDSCILVEHSICSPGGHAAQLPALISQVLGEAGIEIGDLDAIAVSIGPGSFTGLRVGLGFSKGLALARGIPILPVETLAALAVSSGVEGLVASCLDARKEEVYLGIYNVCGGQPRVTMRPVAISPSEAVVHLQEAGPVDLLVGDAADRYPEIAASLSAPFRSLNHCPARGGVIAQLGDQSSARADLAGLVPFYARVSAAEASLTLTQTLP